MVVAGRGAPASVPFMCFLCCRKLPSAETLAAHDRYSELHQQNLKRERALVEQRKDELRPQIWSLRHHIAEVKQQTVAEPANEAVQNQLSALKMQLQQLVGEYGQAQEVLEQGLARRQPQAAPKDGGAAQATFHEARVGKIVLTAGVASWRGNKEVQEDRFLIGISLRSPEGLAISGFCVLDGHSGARCVDLLAARLPAGLQQCLSAKPSLSDESLAQAVAEACELLDREFLRRARELEILDGSTLLLCLVYPEANGRKCRLLVANVGDSRAVLCRAAGGAPGAGTNGGDVLSAVRLSEDHKPARPDERRRIEARGGLVQVQGVWRVFTPTPARFGGRVVARWGLAVSRAFGDLLLKEPERYGCASVAPGGLITSAPEIRTVELRPAEDRFLVLACDGVWDVLSDNDAAAACAGQPGVELAALSLVRRSFAAGSDDNLTALVVTWRKLD
eukprot:NODE_466_length_1545_cov_329.211409.p2 GENE.NODE_466_length_1545_cov_329.211409~~NODE_466_length_1545_cov_329.211409.p2  ORF type:complete len:485 (+),score=152.79 NODE_466_length_1545_cov_329.211409:109-1455(+)